VQAYQQQGIPIYALSVQNEPLYSTTGYPSEYLAASDESTFIASNLGPALSSAGLGSVKIFGYEHNWDNTSYPEQVLGSSAAQYVAGSSFHCYAGDPSAQSTVEAAFPAKDIWFTECSGITSSTFPGDLVWNAEHLLIGATRYSKPPFGGPEYVLQYLGRYTQGEDNMDVGHGQQFTATRRDPSFARTGLALGAVPIATTVVGDGGTMSAAGAHIDRAAEGRGATAGDGQQNLEVGPAEPVPVALDEVCTCAANDVGHL
jgi:hypothetical protein